VLAGCSAPALGGGNALASSAFHTRASPIKDIPMVTNGASFFIIFVPPSYQNRTGIQNIGFPFDEAY
jgi:hypothetical protein